MIGEKIREGGDMLWIIGTGLLGMLLLGNHQATPRLRVMCLVIIGAAAAIQYDLTNESGHRPPAQREAQVSGMSATIMAQNN
jgi:hypothetical protein